MNKKPGFFRAFLILKLYPLPYLTTIVNPIQNIIIREYIMKTLRDKIDKSISECLKKYCIGKTCYISGKYVFISDDGNYEIVGITHVLEPSEFFSEEACIGFDYINFMMFVDIKHEKTDKIRTGELVFDSTMALPV